MCSHGAHVVSWGISCGIALPHLVHVVPIRMLPMRYPVGSHGISGMSDVTSTECG